MAIVRTVLGEISPDDLGVTHPHEHLLVDTGLFWEEPGPEDPPDIRALGTAPVTKENYHLVNERPYASRDNLNLTDRDIAIRTRICFGAAVRTGGEQREAGGCGDDDAHGVSSRKTAWAGHDPR